MKKFSFSMQKVLDLREFEKKQAEAELGKAVTEETRIQDTLNLVAQQRANAVNSINDIKDITGLFNGNNYLRLLDNRKESLLQELASAKLITEQKREILREAMKQVKVLEKLKESRFTEWKKQLLKEEELAMDDIVSSKGN